MDSHFDQVMKARQQAGEGVRRYFAYSTILDRAAFEEWRSQHGYDFFTLPKGRVARALDVGLVYDFPSRWWGGRVAGLREVPGQSVYGLLFDIPEKDWPIIQHKEGAVTGMCVERAVRVEGDGGALDALAFTTNPARASLEGPVSARFIEALRRGAQSAGLPAEYLATLGQAA